MSVFLRWMNSSLVIGIKDVDDQHRALFQKIDDLLEAMKLGRGSEEIIPLIQFLEDYVQYHFETEEKLMQEHHYPGYTAHKVYHDNFRKQYRVAKLSFQETGSPSAWVVQFQHLLRKWVKEHVAKTDMAMGEYLRPILGQQNEA